MFLDFFSLNYINSSVLFSIFSLYTVIMKNVLANNIKISIFIPISLKLAPVFILKIASIAHFCGVKLAKFCINFGIIFISQKPPPIMVLNTVTITLKLEASDEDLQIVTINILREIATIRKNN